jgi:hypothetical protein
MSVGIPSVSNMINNPANSYSMQGLQVPLIEWKDHFGISETL